MRRFCNYFMTIFNVRKLNPFVQFIKPSEYKELKVKVLKEMEVAFNIKDGKIGNGEIERVDIDENEEEQQD